MSNLLFIVGNRRDGGCRTWRGEDGQVGKVSVLLGIVVVVGG
jgi:hypothetical protein